MTVFALLLGALLAVACVVYVALPFLREPAPRDDRLDEPGALERRALELAEERDRALAALKELEFDHRTGKVSDEDYRELVGPLRQQVAETLRPRADRIGREVERRQGGVMGAQEWVVRSEEAPGIPEPARVPEPFPSPGEGEPPQQVPVPEPFPPPDEGDRPQQPTIPEPGPQ